MRQGLIYKLSCNNYFIIGSTVDSLQERMWGYKSKLKRQVHSNPYLQNIYNKYGWKSFKSEVLKNNIPEDVLTNIEDIYIGALNSRIEDKRGGINMRDASRVRRTPETIQKLIEAAKTSPKYEEARLRKIGVPRSLESRQKQSKTIKEGNINSEKSNFSELCVENRFKKLKRKVIQTDMEGNYIKTWDSITEACKFLGKEGVGNTTISAVCRGRENSYMGFKWEYTSP